MATANQNALLDQLQAQVNLVLEQTGRVFAAVDPNSKKAPTAQVNKLKQILPKAQANFQDALDALEEELQLAQLVMRRDLALLRERQGIPTERPATSVQQPVPGPHSANALDQQQPEAEPETEKTINTAPADEDVTMEDSQPEQQRAEAEPSGAEMEVTKTDQKTQPEASAPETTTTSEAPTQPPAPVPPQNDAKSAESGLQVDTAPSKPSGEDEKVPDTAKESINNDLESLFGGGDNTNDGGNEFSFDENATGEIDFGDFGNFNGENADNDNISSLLPGLEDYANTQSNNTSGAELDLNSFFTNTNEQNNTTRSAGGDEARDTTFDDLMDLANFDGNMGDDENNNNSTADLDFDALFN
ncbi:hypothetical protein CB0940_02435 [Cercospora beticola]|uniref:Mediator complex subunit 2 n=1 Tax=Cercospora beticola TaxID=122368 RepID=A0A2G5I4D1_CERBT|nr:hypothetical protein CB0940_02435 [Cercospora beticola]PIA99664.1 hypothetical protein CB0940_02435 [Cercospora beticola]WPA99569.1 hypothetical protein RHO25_004187 [Cercospora beticola]